MCIFIKITCKTMKTFLLSNLLLNGLKIAIKAFFSNSPIFANITIFTGTPIKATTIVNNFPISDVGENFPYPEKIYFN